MDKITFQDATLKTQGYVTINGTNYEIIDSVYENGTELNAAIFNTLQNNIETAINLFKGGLYGLSKTNMGRRKNDCVRR